MGSDTSPLHLSPARFQLAVIHPQIAPNTGNIARLCVATGTPLHLVRPMGFVLSDRELKRSAMDYWPRLKLTLHDDLTAFEQSWGDRLPWFFDSEGTTSLWEASFQPGDMLVLGSETRGVPPDLLKRHPNRCVRIPQIAGERCLNLATAAGIVLYEALRRSHENPIDSGPPSKLAP